MIRMEAVSKRYRSTLTLLLLIASSNTTAAPSEELIEDANTGNPIAQLELGRTYYSENKLKQAHFWYLNSIQNGNKQALAEIGKLFEDHANKPIDNLILAENWFELGNEQGIPEAEEGYSRVLEAQFNRVREKQVSSIAILDQAADEALSNQNNQNNISVANDNKIPYEVLIFISTIALFILVITVRRFFRQKKESKLGTYEHQLSENRRKIRSLQSHLNKAHEQLTKLQRHSQLQSKDQSYNLACSLLGFNPNRVPDEKSIKLRYKKLSRIYHPDAGGSEDEMKRLNAAVKIVASYKSRK